MRYYQCKCGAYQSYSSMGVDQCAFCDKCNTTPAQGPTGHKTKRTAHRLYSEQVETDEGMGTLSKCLWCHQTKREIENKNEPYEVESI